jgi:DnaJ-domain-containing protein 1
MTDAFALLSEPRRPWLDAEALKARFLPLSAAVHPDRVHSASEAEKAAANTRYAELNAAYNALREPRDRLLHLLELEAGGKPKDVQRIPPGTMDLFVEVGQTCRDTDEFLKQKSASDSPMVKLRLMQEGLDWLDRLQALQGRVNAKRDELTAELRQMNGAWEAAPAIGIPERANALPLDRLEQVYRAMSYVARWAEQIQERVVQLAL